MPWSFEGYHRSTAYPHSSIVLPMPPPLSNHSHPSRQGPSDQNQSNQSNPPNRSSRPANPNTPPLPMSSERSAPPPSGRGLTLPSLNPNANQSSTGLQATPPAMSNSRASDSPESSPTAQPPPSLLDRPSAFRFPDDPARPSNRGNGEGVPLAPTHAPQLPLPSEFPGMQYTLTDGFMVDRSNLPHGSGHPPSNLTPPSLSSRRQQLLARRLGQPEHDSDEDLGSSADEEEQMLRYLDEFGVNPTHLRSLVAEDHIRAAQVLRGQLPNKRVASKKALGQLQSVDLDSLSESERTCVICYNDFGQASPEGVIEAPLRLPKCQHVFGDHCIKKWFEESDSCPYCRDKVPSEVALAPSLRTYQNLFRMRRMPGGSSSLTPNDDSILRILAQQETREVARLRARQEGGPDNLSPRPFQPREHPGHASNSASQHDQSTPTPAVFRLGPSPPMQMTPHNPYYSSMPYGVPPPAPYSQQQPAMGSLTPPHFQNPTSSGNNGGPDPTGSEGQLQ
ncbi:hypothetical protein NEMBOFW57_002134 [Staphylotrichum longicolle]|uniref:RING-type domain-containing protein n=1 Tax=Staphylotrichum longicolle TaxID=669026 RepID=A0AAD4F2Y1_9PEZI|nr:hypothetical protein NEMBOFW57_002134 [Staphylotrichum longicolle]